MTDLTYFADGEEHAIPEWLLKQIAADPAATAETLYKMRDSWPPDFIACLQPTLLAFAFDWPPAIETVQSDS